MPESRTEREDVDAELILPIVISLWECASRFAAPTRLMSPACLTRDDPYPTFYPPLFLSPRRSSLSTKMTIIPSLVSTMYSYNEPESARNSIDLYSSWLSLRGTPRLCYLLVIHLIVYGPIFLWFSAFSFSTGLPPWFLAAAAAMLLALTYPLARYYATLHASVLSFSDRQLCWFAESTTITAAIGAFVLSCVPVSPHVVPR
ncbi:hypothetical protein BV25DRAFT_785866 [Artomyces pyxidatus]|uniref:Uncharacterized protein n=1 Tax=Artomyces pyxidatus TaxID=48021 RepID=A0ACB8SZT9_9AGAM|nr:hypothetical protein BV25DRAFT_785866 [Artomyces pyxidatus]